MRLVAKCRECAFPNPRGWVTCARCGTLLGPQGRYADRGTDATTTTQLRVADVAEAAAARKDAKTRLFRPSPASTRDARPLFGQAHALGHLKRALDAGLKEARASLVALEGPAGSGKTRMLQRASELATQRVAEVDVHYAGLRSRDDGPFAPLSRLLLDRFGITPASSPTSVRGKMAHAVGEVLGHDDATRVSEITHLLGHVTGVPFPDSPVLRTLSHDPEALRSRAVEAVAELAAGEARHRPQLWLLDELTDADVGVWEALEAVVALDAPIVVVVTGVSPLGERAAAVAQGTRLRSAELLPLTRGELERLMRSRIPDLIELPEALTEALMHRTGGNPGALEDLIGALQDGGLFQRGERGVSVDLARLESGDLPVTVEDSVRARLAGLSRSEARVMAQASIVGERFWDGALLALARDAEPLPDRTLSPLDVWERDEDELSLHGSLERLETRGFIVQIVDSLTPGLSEYTFNLTGARAILYEGLDDETRKHGHGVVARWLSTSKGLAVEGMAALLAPHLERAGHPQRAAQAYLEAADEERTRMRTTMALRYVERALSLLDPEHVRRRLDALHQRGSLLTTLGRYDEAYSAFEEMARQAWALGARGAGGAALNRIARLHRQRGEHSRALEHLRMALRLFRASEDLRGVASTYDDMAQVHRLRGDIEPALAAAREALEIRVRTRDIRGQGVSLNTLGRIELDRGGFEQAEQHLSTALQLRESVADHEGVTQTRLALGRLAFHRGQLEESVERFTSALEVAREMDNHRFQSYLLSHLGEALIRLGELDRAAEALREAKELAFEMRDQRALAEVERNQGMLALERGEPGAEETLKRALELAREYGTREAIALAHRNLARFGARTLFDSEHGDGHGTEQSFRECVRILQEAGHRPEVARTQVELAMHLLERGDRKDARSLLSEARVALEQLGLPELVQVKDTLASL